MLRATAGWGYNVNTTTLYRAITDAGLTTNLQVCLDAADPASWPGSGTKWLDRSGNGYDFFLGTDGTTSAPIFVNDGTKSYWSFDGSTFFRYDTTNETWMQNLHKNNAIFSGLAIWYNATNSTQTFFGDTGSVSAGTGVSILNNNQTLLVRSAGSVVNTTQVAASAGNNSWHFSGISLTEATGSGGGFFYLDGGYNQVSGSDTWDSTYTSPSAGSASQTMEIAARGGGNTPASSGSKLSALAIWGGTAISKANMDTLYAAMRGRFGL